jgi:hypothetical protein
MMDHRAQGGQARARPAGLCERCVHVQHVSSSRGSRFYLCRLSVTDSRFPRYPVIPVLQCAGYQAAEPDR